MTIRPAIISALQGRMRPMAGRDVAAIAGLPYKQAIDGLGRMLDAGFVVRFGSKKGSKWALTGSPAAAPDTGLAALERLWGTPHPQGGRPNGPPAAV